MASYMQAYMYIQLLYMTWSQKYYKQTTIYKNLSDDIRRVALADDNNVNIFAFQEWQTVNSFSYTNVYHMHSDLMLKIQNSMAQ